MRAEDLPFRVVVDEHGHYWRDYGKHWSMCPVSDENISTEPIAVYERVPDPTLHEMEVAAYANAARDAAKQEDRLYEVMADMGIDDWKAERIVACARAMTATVPTPPTEPEPERP